VSGCESGHAYRTTVTTFAEAGRRRATMITPTPSPLRQRACSNHEGVHQNEDSADCRAGGLLQRRRAESAEPREVPTIVHEVLRGPASPLEADTRRPLESQFHTDFSRVRVHTDVKAARSARAVGALAYTVGRDIVFGAGSFSPRTRSGRDLLAHELAHVVQQERFGPGSTCGVHMGAAHDSFEEEADRASAAPAERAASGPPVLTAGPHSLQRLGPWEWLTRFFGGGTFSEKELQSYLHFLDTEHRIEDNFDSDNKAREVVRRWKRGDTRYILPPRRKILLVQEMLSGFVSDDDERQILELLTGSGTAELEQVVSAVGEQRLHSSFGGDNRKELAALLQRGRKGRQAGGQAQPDEVAAARETFPAETILEAQQRFTSNAELEHNLRKNCIEIVRSIAPQLLGRDPQLAARATTALGRLRGQTLTMEDAMKALTGLGAAVGPTVITFDNGNGNSGAPTQMLGSAWDTIVSMVGNVPGWHIFGFAVFDGYHSVTIFVDNRPTEPIVYWADQWAIEAGEDFRQAPGSVSGFRRYKRGGLDAWITEITRKWWNDVHRPDSKCGQRHPANWDTACRYSTSLKIWKFQASAPQMP